MRVQGHCYVYLAIDIGFSIDLKRFEQVLASDQIPQAFRRPRRAPEPSQLTRHSARIAQAGQPIAIASFRAEATAEITVWEFGAASIAYRIPIDAELSELSGLSDLLWDNQDLLADARARLAQLLDTIKDAVDRPLLGERAEDYVVFDLRLPPGTPTEVIWTTHASTTASILRSETATLAPEEVHEALAMRCAYVPDEVVLVDWFAAVLVGGDMEDERLVIELAVAELLELRLLDEQLDRGIDAAYGVLTRKHSWLASLRTRADDIAMVSQLQAEAAVLFEGVDNALKLLGDQYLARLYRVVSNRFHLPQWDVAIERKLRVLDSIYEKLAARAASRRFEALEVIIVILIAVEMAMTVVPQLWPK